MILQTKTIIVPQGADRLVPVYIRVLTDPTKYFNKDTNPWIPRNLTGYSARMAVKEDYNTPDTVLFYTSTDNLVITPLEGKIDIAILALDTEPLIIDEEFVDYVYDLEIYLGTYVQRILTGKFRIYKNVTE